MIARKDALCTPSLILSIIIRVGWSESNLSPATSKLTTFDVDVPSNLLIRIPSSALTSLGTSSICLFLHEFILLWEQIRVRVWTMLTEHPFFRTIVVGISYDVLLDVLDVTQKCDICLIQIRRGNPSLTLQVFKQVFKLIGYVKSISNEREFPPLKYPFHEWCH